MTVRELYDYAISHSLIDQQVDDVLAIYYNKETSLNTPIQQSNLTPILSPLPSCALLKCIIPKGAYYFEGYFDESPSYASSQIKILEEIKI